MSKYIVAKESAFKLIEDFSKTKIGNRYLTLKNGKNVFFTIFIKKYRFRKGSMRFELLSFYNK